MGLSCTPVPKYIGLIAEGRYAEAYMVNWEANVFPGILGRTCDRPCEPACRRGRVEKEPVAICRLKRAAADYKGDISSFLPKPASMSNGRRIALVGGDPASLTVARDLALLGYRCVIIDQDPQAGGMMRTRIPKFRVPEQVLDEETGYILALGVEFRGGTRVASLKAMLAEGWDAVFVGSGAPRGQDLDLPGPVEAGGHIHVGVEWLANISFQYVSRIGRRVVVIGGGNTAMDCSRSARRLGGEDVKVVVRSGFKEMKAATWEKDDVLREGITICNDLVPKSFTHEDGRLTGVLFEPVNIVHQDGRRTAVPTGAPVQNFPCDDVVIAIGQEPTFTWIERDLDIEFGTYHRASGLEENCFEYARNCGPRACASARRPRLPFRRDADLVSGLRRLRRALCVGARLGGARTSPARSRPGLRDRVLIAPARLHVVLLNFPRKNGGLF